MFAPLLASFSPGCKALSKPRNIVAEKQFASQDAKMFPIKFRNIFVVKTMFSSLPTCFQMFPTRETLFSRLGMFKQCLKTILQT